MAVTIALSSLLRVGIARAADDDETSNPLSIDVHGFVSQGFIKTTQNNYLADSKRGSFEFSEVGINFTKSLTDRMRVGMQLFTHDLGPLGNYRTRFDWFYLDYRFADWLGVRAGRTKLPFGLYNETSDIDAARTAVLLPQSVYPVSNRDYLLAQTGGEIYGDISLADAGALEYRLYGGTVFFDTADLTTTLTNVTVPYIFGGRLMWQAPLEGLQLGGSMQKLRIDAGETLTPAQAMGLMAANELPANFMGSVSLRLPATLWVGSAEYVAHDFSLAAEYSRWIVGVESSLLIPKQTITSERGYLMGSYHVTPWFTPGLYYSLYFPSVDQRHGRAAYQHDVAATFRYDLNAYWLLKLEGHYMRGTAGLDSTLNGNTPLSGLIQDWGVLLVKTTAYF